jgi:hypothetical protein
MEVINGIIHKSIFLGDRDIETTLVHLTADSILCPLFIPSFNFQFIFVRKRSLNISILDFGVLVRAFSTNTNEC